MKKKPFRIGIVGFGTVGRGTAQILLLERERMARQAGVDIELARIADVRTDLGDTLGLGPGVFTTDFRAIINDPSIDVVVELVGGTTIAASVITETLKAGKHAVTANKALLAEQGNLLFAMAREQERMIGFEAAVCGGIPVIRSLREGLAGNTIQSLFGIVNGTANFILSKMRFEKLTFKAALKEAQRLGVAEADPTFDIKGIDSAHKISILASLAFGQFYRYQDFHIEGITAISDLDITYAEEMGYVIKLLGVAIMTPSGRPFISIAPTLIPADEILAAVNYEYNGVFIKGNFVGHTLYTGKGAGGLPTGSAVVSDIVHIARYGACEKDYLLMYPDGVHGSVVSIDEIEAEYYIRLTAFDKPGVMAKISGVLGAHGISIATLMQKESTVKGDEIIVIKTHASLSRNDRSALDEVNRLDVTVEKAVKLRIINDLYKQQ